MQVIREFLQQRRIITNKTQRDVAAHANPPAKVAFVVAMIEGKATASSRRPIAHLAQIRACAARFLLLRVGIPLRHAGFFVLNVLGCTGALFGGDMLSVLAAILGSVLRVALWVLRPPATIVDRVDVVAHDYFVTVPVSASTTKLSVAVE